MDVIFEIIIFYLFVVGCYKIINKHELKELTIADGIILILTIQLMLEVVFNENKNILLIIIPLVTFILIKPLLKMVGRKNNICDNKIIVIKDGKINFSELSKINYNIENLMKQLEELGVKRIENIKIAYIDGGKLMIKNHNGPYSIIYEGKIDYQALKEINKNQDWLLEILESKNLKLKNIYYSFYDNNKIYFIQKDL